MTALRRVSRLAGHKSRAPVYNHMLIQVFLRYFTPNVTPLGFRIIRFVASPDIHRHIDFTTPSRQ